MCTLNTLHESYSAISWGWQNGLRPDFINFSLLFLRDPFGFPCLWATYKNNICSFFGNIISGMYSVMTHHRRFIEAINFAFFFSKSFIEAIFFYDNEAFFRAQYVFFSCSIIRNYRKGDKSSKGCTWSAVPDALFGVISWRSGVVAGQRPQKADVL